jgi:hypothetical protein
MFSTRTKQNAAFQAKIAHLALPLRPLVSITTGRDHTYFPRTLLHYHLLTDAELEELAHFYHQRTPSMWTAHYPKPMNWKHGLSVDEKRRKFGKFIGLRGCDSPVRTEEELQDELRREARRIWMAEEDEMMRRKRESYY